MKLTDLNTVAFIVQEAARQEVLTRMEAHQRFNPGWEVGEVALHYAIRNGLLTYFQKWPEPKPRIAIEYSDISNIELPPEYKRHPVDLAILHPLAVVTEPYPKEGYAWANENKAVLGLIEVKKNWWTAPPGGFAKDVKWLAEVGDLPPKPHMRELEWVMLVLFLAGPTKETVDKQGKDVESTVACWAFQALTQSNPSEAPSHPGTANVDDRWFEVMCFGRSARDARECEVRG